MRSSSSGQSRGPRRGRHPAPAQDRRRRGRTAATSTPSTTARTLEERLAPESPGRPPGHHWLAPRGRLEASGDEGLPHRGRAAAIAGRSTPVQRRVHLDYYLVLTNRPESLVVAASTLQDPPTDFRKEAEAMIKTFRFGPPSLPPELTLAAHYPSNPRARRQPRRRAGRWRRSGRGWRGGCGRPLRVRMRSRRTG